ncbi:hypothetical protein [Rubellimicrobium arenae]|uniref:hypothetical protein n=1 Tax=Rubellimicrobium arenae TaxID=2817372 RepID=UPI001B315932|nr:hypothetical protein [Rubellimicrobium arenae]
MRRLTAALVAVLGLTACAASAATVTPAVLDFEDAALGSTGTSLVVGDYLVLGMGDRSPGVVAGDPTGATGNASQLLAAAGGAFFTLQRLDVQPFRLAGLDVSAVLDSGLAASGELLISDGDGTTLASIPLTGDSPVFVNLAGSLSSTTSLQFAFAPGSTGTFAIDNVALAPVAPIPAPTPAAALLLGLGLLGAAARRRRA